MIIGLLTSLWVCERLFTCLFTSLFMWARVFISEPMPVHLLQSVFCRRKEEAKTVDETSREWRWQNGWGEVQAWARHTALTRMLLAPRPQKQAGSQSYKSFFSFIWSYAEIPTIQSGRMAILTLPDWLEFQGSFNWSWKYIYRIRSRAESHTFSLKTPHFNFLGLAFITLY